MSMEFREGMVANNSPLTEERNARYCISLLLTENRSQLNLKWSASVFLALVAQWNSL